MVRRVDRTSQPNRKKNSLPVFMDWDTHPIELLSPLLIPDFWHGMNIDVANWCRSCKGCQTAKISRHNKPVFGKFTEPNMGFDQVYVDIVGPLPYSDFQIFTELRVDFTFWPEAIPLVDIRAETVADAFFSGRKARSGTPATITTDTGPQFESNLWDNLCNQFGIVRNRTTSYHPVKRHVRTFSPSA